MFYTQIFHPIRKAYNLSLIDYCVLDKINRLSGNPRFDGWCVMSQQLIADELDISRDTVNRAYKTLETKKLIEFRHSSQNDTGVRPTEEWRKIETASDEDIAFSLKREGVSISRIPPKFLLSASAKTDKLSGNAGGSSNLLSGTTPQNEVLVAPAKADTLPPAKADTTNKRGITTKNLYTPIVPKGDGGGFDEFWKTYPKKAAKPTALRAWNKLRVTPELFEKILTALEVQKKSDQWTKDGGQYVPNPATWLNARRWEDELPQNSARPPSFPPKGVVIYS